MSTRSGKQIHKSFQENTSHADAHIIKDERRTRGRRAKDNSDTQNISLSQKRKNYVSFPGRDEHNMNGEIEIPRSLRNKNTLREILTETGNTADTIITTEPEENNKTAVRVTRRTKRFADEDDTKSETIINHEDVSKPSKKSKKDQILEISTTEKENILVKKQKKKPKKKKLSKNSFKVEENKATQNNTNNSVDSFHSASGSPVKIDSSLNTSKGKSSNIISEVTDVPKEVNRKTKKKTKSKKKSKEVNNESETTSIIKAVENNIAQNNEINGTFEIEPKPKRKSSQLSITSCTGIKSTEKLKRQTSAISLNDTFDKTTSMTKKLDSTFDKTDPTKMSSEAPVNVTFDKSDENLTRISIISDDSKNDDYIFNATPVLIESSMDTSSIESEKKPKPITSLRREGTFTKDESEIVLPVKQQPSGIQTPTKRNKSLPSPGCTPFHLSVKANKEKPLLNVTRSIEKARRSLIDTARATKVMFCSPVDSPHLNTLRKSKIIKSSMKGSNKSFLFEDSGSARPAARKRSYTHNDVEDARVKRKKLTEELQESVNRLSRPRTSSAGQNGKEPDTTPNKKPVTPRALSETKARKLPNFAALHKRQFAKMESLDECQQRKAKRAKQLMVPTGSLTVLERSSPKSVESAKKEAKPTPSKTKPESKPAYTRFGFKLNLDTKPFKFGAKTDNTKSVFKLNFTPKAPQPVIEAATVPRKDAAKQIIMREKSSTTLKGKRDIKRCENRTIIKGVRTNRRFELQMKSRNMIG